jgi:hypothetical protein
MSGVAFPDRILQVTVTVTRPDAQAAGGSPQVSTYVWQHNRIRVSIRLGGSQFGNAVIEVFGVPLQDMNNIARLWLKSLTPQNTDTVAVAVWNGQTFTPLFQGVVSWAQVDASGLPMVKLIIEANTSFAAANTPAAPYANAGPVTLKAALTTIAQAAGYTVNYAASAPQYQLTDVRVTGSVLDQIGAMMRYFPDLVWTPNLQQILVRAEDAPLTTDPVRVAVDTGMQQAPVYSTSGLQFVTLFNPQILPGTALNVETIFDFVNQTNWIAHVIQHQLDANMPSGQWATSVAANSYGLKGNNDGNTPAA